MSKVTPALVVAMATVLATSGLAAAVAQSPAAPASPPRQGGLAIPGGAYKMDANHSSLTWSILHNGLSNYKGRLTKLDAMIELNPADLGSSKIVLNLDPTSISTNHPGNYKMTHTPRTGFQSFDEDIAMSKRFMDAGTFKTINFTSTSVKQTGVTSAQVVGDLKFMGVTKPVTMNVTLTGQTQKHPQENRPAIGFKAEGVIDRTVFGQPPFAPLSDAVHIEFNGEFIRVAEGTPAPPR